MAPIVHPSPASSRARRNTARNFSYAELTSSDESESDLLTQAPSQVRRSARQNKRHREPESESISDETDLPAHAAKRSQRSLRRNYKEPDSEDDSFLNGVRPEIIPVKPPRPLHLRPQPRSRRKPVHTNQYDPTRTKIIHRQFNIPRRSKTFARPTQRVAPSLPPSHKIPPWTELPYEILAQILRNASYPLYEGLRPSSSINWLLDVSLLSRSFHEAAVSTLLRSPPLYPIDRAHGLINLLDDDRPHRLQFNTKIKRLDVEVRSVLIRKSRIDLQHLLRLVPGLQHLRLYHNHDYFGSVMWAQPSASHAKWAYPQELFDTLDETGIRLKSWTWNGRFPNTTEVSRIMAETHDRAAFRRLRSLALMNLTPPQKTSERIQNTIEDSITEGLSKLFDLEELELENCLIVNERLMTGLPRSLRRLSLVNCNELISPALEAFLRLGGQHLIDLRLDGNQSLDLGFLNTLSGTCPRLSQLRMDLSYSDGSAFHDVNPHFDELLPSGPPSWPEHIQTIDLVQLRNLNAEAAESFLQSLMDAAPRLRSLRILNLKLILNLAWRERSNIRTKWSNILERTFLRKASDPTSFVTAGPVRQAFNTADSSLPRPSSSGSTSSNPTTDDHFTNSTRRSTRIAQVQSTRTRFDVPQEREDSFDLEGLALPVQGMCTFVKLAVDNQRPSEIQLTEANFMDEEPEDEEWTGKDPEPRGGYAW